MSYVWYRDIDGEISDRLSETNLPFKQNEL